MKVILWAAALIGIWSAGVSEAVETKVVVRAKSKDAKFIGSSMGGARVVIRESDTGALLREGFTSGGTGDAEKLMIEPIQRGVPLSDATAAKYETTLEIDRPTRITVSILSVLRIDRHFCLSQKRRQTAASHSTGGATEAGGGRIERNAGA